MKKIVIIPAYNEEKSITQVVNNILQKSDTFDYIVINDCSTDNTLQTCLKNKFSVIDLPVNLGIGGAVQKGYIFAKNNGYDIAVQVDGDGQHDVAFLEKLILPIERNEADLVVGSRFIEKNKGFKSSLVRRIGIKYFEYLLQIFAKVRITDPTSGYRACNKELIDFFSNNYPKDYPEPESIMIAKILNKRVVEVPVAMKARISGRSSINGANAFYYVIKVTFGIIRAKFAQKR